MVEKEAWRYNKLAELQDEVLILTVAALLMLLSVDAYKSRTVLNIMNKLILFGG